MLNRFDAAQAGGGAKRQRERVHAGCEVAEVDAEAVAARSLAHLLERVEPGVAAPGDLLAFVVDEESGREVGQPPAEFAARGQLAQDAQRALDALRAGVFGGRMLAWKSPPRTLLEILNPGSGNVNSHLEK